MKKHTIAAYAFWILLAEGAGGAVGWLTREGVRIYTETIVKPPFSPPPIVFPVAWTLLYALMGVSAARIALAPGVQDRARALCCNEFGGANYKCSKTGNAIVRSNDALRFALYGGLIVDPCGDRFMNEQYLSDRPLALGGEMSLRVARYYAVVDQAMYEECRDKGVLSYFGKPKDWYVGNTGYTTELLPNLDEHMQQAIDEKWAFKGTLAECAEFFGLENLEQAVADYNALCAAKKDDQFYKSSYLLRELTGDTFYVMEYEPSIWCTFGGVKTDAYSRAVTPQQEPIPGLYVAGVDNGSLYASPYYENEGAALGTAYTSGIVAADCMIDYIQGV